MPQEYAGPPRARIQESTRGYEHQAVASAHTQTRCVGRLKLARGRARGCISRPLQPHPDCDNLEMSKKRGKFKGRR